MSKRNQYTRNIVIATPFLLLAIAPFALAASPLGISVDIRLVGLGALGWWIALLLRLPVILLAKKLPQSAARTAITLASGPAEETVRLVVLVAIGLTTGNAYSVGLGWSAIEIIYSIIQGFGMASLQRRTDAQAEQAKTILTDMGMNQALKPAAPYMGIIERLGANALHISWSLLLVVSPYLVIATAPLHSLINLVFTKSIKRSLITTEIVFASFGAALFALSIALVTR